MDLELQDQSRIPPNDSEQSAMDDQPKPVPQPADKPAEAPKPTVDKMELADPKKFAVPRQINSTTSPPEIRS